MKVNENARLICELLQDDGFKAVIVGGAVRDSLLGKNPKDWDIATSAEPEQIEKSLHRHFIMKEVGKSFGVVLAKKDEEDFEIASFRTDFGSDGRRPKSIVLGATILEDAKRRDLTINAMFYDPIGEELIDFFNGQEDLRNKTIRFIGKADTRIQEDHLRMLRAIRLSLKLGFTINLKSFLAIQNNATLINKISPERINSELCRMINDCHDAETFIRLFHNSGLMKEILPELSALYDCPQSKPWHCEGPNVIDHVTLVFKNAVEMEDTSLELKLGALFHDIGKAPTVSFKDEKVHYYGHDHVGTQMTIDLMKRLKFTNEQIDIVSSLTRDHMAMHQAHKFKKSTLKRFIAQPNSRLLMQLGFCDSLGAIREDGTNDLTGVSFFKEALENPENSFPKLFITGRELIEAGLKPGPHFKDILNKILDLQLEGKIKTKEEALQKIKDFK